MTLLYDYALRLAGLPYRWGGDTPMIGFDCSGLVRLLLHSQGIYFDSPGNADSLHAFFSLSSNHQSTIAQLGALAFYANGTGSIDHVALCLTPTHHIEAAGGDHTTTSLDRAVEQKAFVRITKLRSNVQSIFVPNYVD